METGNGVARGLRLLGLDGDAKDTEEEEGINREARAEAYGKPRIIIFFLLNKKIRKIIK